MKPPGTSRPPAAAARAFTIVEVLATLMLAGIVLPPAMRGIGLCLRTAGFAAQQAQAAALAQTKLDELVATGELSDAKMEGDFGDEVPGYTWTAELSDWQDDRLVQLDVTVAWVRRGQQRTVTLTTLVYNGIPSE